MVKDDNYIQISGWMIRQLGLKGNELLIYALIHGFSQDGKSFFQGSLTYIAEWTNSTKQGVIKNLKSLIEKGYVQKIIVKSDGGLQFCKYYTVQSRVVEKTGKQSLPPDRSTKFTTIQEERGKQSLPPQSTEFTDTSQQSVTGGKQSLPNKNLEILDINSTTAEIHEKQKPEEADPLPLQKIKELFGGHFAFDERFIPEIVELASQFELDSEQIPTFLQYVFELSETKNPKSLTNMFYKLAKSPAIMQDFVLKEKHEAKAVSRMAAVCPVCGKMAKINGLCPGCGFDMLMSRDAREVSMHKQILSLSEEDRQRFREEYHTEIERQVSMGLDATIRNPALREEFSSRLSAICRKYGITA